MIVRVVSDCTVEEVEGKVGIAHTAMGTGIDVPLVGPGNDLAVDSFGSILVADIEGFCSIVSLSLCHHYFVPCCHPISCLYYHYFGHHGSYRDCHDHDYLLHCFPMFFVFPAKSYLDLDLCCH